jgi:adenosyl cobinamide kinase/adenosyl cobinamide phosphate guanylyltransferase
LAIPVTYLATGAGLDSDPELLARVDLAQIEMAQIEMARIERHRSRRPAEWATVEVNDPGRLATDLADCSGVALVDSLGAWLAAWSNFDATIGQLVGIISNRRWPTIVVSEEVGLSVHPPTESGRRFVERLGVANQTLAAAADRVELVVAGVPLVLKEAR